MTCDRRAGFRGERDEWKETLDAWREISRCAPVGPAPAVSEDLLRMVARRPRRRVALPAAAGLLVLAALGGASIPRPERAFALTDREIFWGLSYLCRSAEAIESEMIDRDGRPGIHDIGDSIDRLLRHPLFRSGAAGDRPPDREAMEMHGIDLRLLQIESEMEEWI